jgi:type I restriction enzyme R subunit
LALKITARNVALTDSQAAEVAAAVLGVADQHCFTGWWSTSSVDPELSKALLLLIAQRFGTMGLLADDAMGFIATLVQLLKCKHYKPRNQTTE